MIRHSDGSVTALPPLPAALGTAKSVKPAPAANAPAAPEPTRVEIEQAVSSANEQMHTIAPSLQFEVDADTRQVVIRLVDRQDQRVLRQVPSPEMLEIARALERMQALLLRTRA
jgi:flagellar protein FlaG